MLEVATDATPPGTVAEEIAAGYVIGDRVLRPAMVAVAKRAPGSSDGLVSPAGGAGGGQPAQEPAAAGETTTAADSRG
jgi:molecular chaperone GrpE